MQEDVLSIEEAFGDLRDPRSRTPAHDLTEMLVVAPCAVLSGTDSWVAIQTWTEAKLEWLRRYLPLVNGIASHDTFGRVFAALDAQQFEACFIRWTAHLCPALARAELISPKGAPSNAFARRYTEADLLTTVFREANAYAY
ncbi:ISAs1 family transposase [Paraburkholderia phytofirmans]|uniref:H repeat-associated protein N-terminal domain-containing protein n=1 Tax=Paraburkholderia phytofirmans OLGA172 TaxID=1417228 RepID=A0A160FQI2_9BURK|nr:ISAs1 family transposase [Paraburkholderia phytofirmans]ANB75165.1 hypothetical protein AYM40_22380 [Paraburkholderia phytofirmans OLGA172]